ncbi:uncharacterized protein DNG_01230 [Cephalotrichum gorgonifer]|uniref:Uncharacterized protein n=1 Tax=Cephalotrichum gorgonifer TaxID=2041049 RepID=A0AAE8MSP1_9PEZI|nr:uncharacterized protein DNG_01230 [Cephalotrichum gorgonifer]
MQLHHYAINSIIEAACLYCGPPRKQLHEIHCHAGIEGLYCEGRKDQPAYVTTLASLCLVSRQFNAIATPHLYHQPTTSNWELLARTLINRPDLAGRVKHLCTRGWNPSYVVDTAALPPEVTTYWDDIRQQRHEDGEYDVTEDEDSWIARDKVALVLTLCPNIEELDTIIYGHIYVFCLIKPGSLVKLKTIAIAHGGSQYGFYFDELAPFAEGAPNITRIITWQTGIVDGVGATFENVTYLQLGCSTIGARELRIITEACPNIISLEYEAGGPTVGEEQFSPLELEEILADVVPCLRMLTLSMVNSVGPTEIPLEGWLFRSFAGWEDLEYLALDTRCFLAHWANGICVTPDGELGEVEEGQLPAPSRTALVDLLPRSIGELRITYSSAGDMTRLKPALETLALSSRGHFPGLARVVIPGRGVGDVEGLRNDFKGWNVEFVLT